MVKQFRTQKQDTAIWKILEHSQLDTCPECSQKESLTFLGFVETYVVGSHAKMYQCRECEAWIDVIWSKRLGRYQDNAPAGV